MLNSICRRHFSDQTLIFKSDRKTTIAILLDDDGNLNPYQLQVPGNHTPPAAASLITNIYTLKNNRKLDLIPATLDLMYVALGQSRARTDPIEERFEKFIVDCKQIYDLILIDCHPAGSIFTKTSLNNSDHVIIPVVPQRYAVRGIGLMLEFIRDKRRGTSGPTPHILFNLTPRAGIPSEETRIRGDRNFRDYCMTATLKRYKAFSDPEDGQGFVWFSTRPHSTSAFFNALAVAREFVARIGG